jgi:uncharacterized membrane protein
MVKNDQDTLKLKLPSIRLEVLSEFDWKMPISRFEALIDGVFAITITLMVLPLIEFIHQHAEGIEKFHSNTEVLGLLYDLGGSFSAFIVAFFLLALFWRASHRYFDMLKYMDSKLFWLSVIWLIFIVLIPFSTYLSGISPNLQMPVIVYHFNLLLIMVLNLISVHYIFNHTHLLKKGEDPRLISWIKLRAMVIIIILLLAIMVTMASYVFDFRPSISSFVFILLPFALEYVKPKKKS